MTYIIHGHIRPCFLISQHSCGYVNKRPELTVYVLHHIGSKAVSGERHKDFGSALSPGYIVRWTPTCDG